MSKGLTLALDGSTSTCSVALLGADEVAEPGIRPAVLARRSEPEGRSQARVLLRLVDEMLEEVSATPAHLEQVVVGTGPGTFTGVRIAVATARGLAVGLRIPVYGVSTLMALAACGAEDGKGGLREDAPSVVPVVDARRQQVFFAVYETQKRENTERDRIWVRHTPIGISDRGRLWEALANAGSPIVVVGQNTELVGELPAGSDFTPCEAKAEYLVLGRHWMSDATEPHAGDAETDVSELGAGSGAPEDVRPIYVRAPDADIHITKMKDPWAVDESK